MKHQTKSLRRPIVMYNVTEECPMRCTHCYNESGGNNRYTPSDDQLRRDTNKLSRYAGALNFTGGEPFQVPILPELLALSSSNGADNIITTSGLRFMKKDAPKLLEGIQEHVYMMKIGMMGATSQTNDYVRGRGHFDVATKSLDLIAKYDFVTCMKISLDRHNAHEVDDFCRFALEHNVDQIVFGQLVDMGRASQYMQDFVFGSDDIQRVGEDLQKAKEKYWDQIKIARHCTLSGLCQDEGHFYTVNTRGAVSPCLMREDLAMGDISTDDLTDLFGRVDKIRKTVKTHPSMRDKPLEELAEEKNISLSLVYQVA